MSAEIKVPAVGESISSGIISLWHRQDGDYVRAGDLLFTLDTDKVSTEVAAQAAGIVRIKAPADTEVKIGEVVGLIEEAPEPAASAPVAAPLATPAGGSSATAVFDNDRRRGCRRYIFSNRLRQWARRSAMRFSSPRSDGW